MLANYDFMPKSIEEVGNGSIRYRYDISKGEVVDMDGEKRDTYNCKEVIVFKPLSANKITEAVLVDTFGNNYEQKLINEFNSAQMGLMPDDVAKTKIDAYKNFLIERARLKAQVDADWAEYAQI